MTPNSIYGVFTHFGKLENADICTCGDSTAKVILKILSLALKVLLFDQLSFQVRKVLKTHVTWSPEMEDLSSEKFKTFKNDMETKVL